MANPSGKISGDPVATTLVGLDYAAIQAGGNVQVPQSLLDAKYVATGGPLGTPSSGVATNLTGTASGLTAGHVAANAVTNASLAQMAAQTVKGNNTGSTANAADIQFITFPYTGSVWTSNTTPALVNRLDRVFVGGATVNSGDLPATTKDWLETLIPNTTTLSQNASLSPQGEIGTLGGSRAADAPSVGQGTMGLAGFVQNNLSGNSAYAGYFEAWTNSATNALATHGIEVDVVNKSGATPTLTPFSSVQTNLSVAAWLASGGSRSGVSKASAALMVINNGATFNKGMIVSSGALDTAVGAGGNGVALEIARGQSARWLNSGGTTDAEVYGNASGLNIPQTIVGSKATLTNTVASGQIALVLSGNQIQPNPTDTNDTVLDLNYLLSASSASNELVSRVMKFGATNSLTGGGHVTFQRLMEMDPVISTGAVTDTMEYIYIGAWSGGGSAGTVYGIHIPAGMNGTDIWGIKDESTTNWSMGGSFATKSPTTLTGTSGSMGKYDGSLIIGASGTFTLTLLSAATYPGRWVHLKSTAAQIVNSATSNVVPLGSATAGTAIFTATITKWASLQSDGANWIVMAGN